MKIEFDDGGYIEFSLSQLSKKVIITIGAKDYNKPTETIVNSAEISFEQLTILIDSLDGFSLKQKEEKPKKKKKTSKKKKSSKKTKKKTVEGDEDSQSND